MSDTRDENELEDAKGVESSSLLAQVWILEFSLVELQFHNSTGDMFKMAHPSSMYVLIGVFTSFEDLENAQMNFAAHNDLVYVQEKYRWMKKADLRG